MKKHRYTASVIIDTKKIQLHLQMDGESTLHEFRSIESLNGFLHALSLDPFPYQLG